jgi:hypothetical protein
VEHEIGNEFLTIIYTVDPPTVFEMQLLLDRNLPSLKNLDIHNANIINQIKYWKAHFWKVSLSAPLPLLPSNYVAAAIDEYSWISVPKKNKLRSTDIGDNEMDVEYRNDHFNRYKVQHKINYEFDDRINNSYVDKISNEDHSENEEEVVEPKAKIEKFNTTSKSTKTKPSTRSKGK